MKAVFLDFATMGADVLDPSPLLAVAPELQIFDSTADTERLDRIKDAELVFTNKVKVGRELLDAAQSLRFIGLAATGTDNIDLVRARERGIAVSNIRAYCTQSVVEHVFGLMLSLTHSIGQYDRSVKNGEWQRAHNFCMLQHPVRELSAMTLGIIGYGELGKSVERTARMFNMNVAIARRHGAAAQSDDGRADIDELLDRADVITLHCPLNESTQGLFGKEQFHRMKKTAILINTARGGLVQSAELVAALENGEIGGAAIDVLPQEPPVDGDPLLDYTGDNLILTPHIAWATEEARQNAINELAANARAFLDGERRNRVV